MLNTMPISLILAWAVFFGLVNTHQRHARRLLGTSARYSAAVRLSSVFGSLVGAGLLIYYFMQVAWYWPLLLFVIGSSIGGLFFSWLDKRIGGPGVSFFAFFGWPISAAWAFLIIRVLQP
jgi:hypothetical protein